MKNNQQFFIYPNCSAAYSSVFNPLWFGVLSTWGGGLNTACKSTRKFHEIASLSKTRFKYQVRPFYVAVASIIDKNHSNKTVLTPENFQIHNNHSSGTIWMPKNVQIKKIPLRQFWHQKSSSFNDFIQDSYFFHFKAWKTWIQNRKCFIC